MRRRIPFLAAVIVMAAAPAASAHENGCLSPHSWVGGAAWLCKGTLVYGDYVDDDFGADTGAFDSTSRTAGLAPSAGDQTYPSSHDDGTADLVKLSLRRRGGKLVITGAPGTHAEYTKRHNPIWPELEDVLRDHGVWTYSIFAHPDGAVICLCRDRI